MLSKGLFSGNPENKYQVDTVGLKELTVEKLEAGLQSRPGNELAGLQGRTDLLIRLGGALGDKADYFGQDGRPGNMIGMCALGTHRIIECKCLQELQIISCPTLQRKHRRCSLFHYQCCGMYS